MLIIYKTIDLYSNVCNLLPIDIPIPKQEVDDLWHIDKFEWCKPVGDVTNVNLFLNLETMKWKNF